MDQIRLIAFYMYVYLLPGTIQNFKISKFQNFKNSKFQKFKIVFRKIK